MMSLWLWVVILIVFGFVLLLIELLIIPGFGFAGILGLASLASACIMVWRNLGTIPGLLTVGGSLLLVTIILIVFSRSEFYRNLKLQKTQTAKNGFRSSREELETLVGEEGTSKSALRPSGTAKLRGKQFSVVTEGDFVSPGEKVKVLKVEGNRIVVRKI